MNLSLQHAMYLLILLSKMKKQNKLLKRLKQTNKAVQLFIKTTKDNYLKMKNKLGTIWAANALLILAAIMLQSCNVTRKVTTESSFFQKGDTTTTITVKTIESYDATKKGAKL